MLRLGLAAASCLMLGACATPRQTSQFAPGNDTLNVADAAIAGGNPQMALKIAQSTLAQNPHDEQALYHEGAAYYAMDRCEDSIAAYRLALGQNPHSSEAQTGIGRCLIRRNAPEAERAFAAAVADDPQNANAQSDLGVARALSGNAAGAVAPLQQALLLAPGTSPPRSISAWRWRCPATAPMRCNIWGRWRSPITPPENPRRLRAGFGRQRPRGGGAAGAGQ
ncbi:tetratricopeptide repeat protein [Acidocella sp. MX-AZ03]|uniref:tetratricopeptide repeat protein n=1 Tax=Acidocella sp. MX-AZ03 TaxID=2697363 RepID=UPI0022DE1006|nr:tetratricopeptide repeat protein [Acidocella sp. MX-AZ03]WBO59758.1 tetratricopeptide repeat protein [Acidocella sp. MX-AZ03]